MPRIAFIYRTDTHVADTNPASWKGDYPAEIWSNLEQVGQFARVHEAKAVLDGGDYFHIKRANRNPHSLNYKSARIHGQYPCPTFCVEGNHDLSYNNLESIERQPLGVLYESKVFTQLRDQVFKDGDLQVRVVGMPYSPFRKLEELRAIQKQPGDTFLVAVVHQLAGEKPPATVEEFFGEPVFRYADLITPNGPDIWCFGHWHKDQGICEIVGRSFVTVGAVCRGALIKENLERTPKVTLIEATLEGIKARALELQVAPGSDVFDVERKDREDKEEEVIHAFIKEMYADLTIDPEANIETTLSSLNFSKDIKDLALQYLSEARAGSGIEGVG